MRGDTNNEEDEFDPDAMMKKKPEECNRLHCFVWFGQKLQSDAFFRL